MEPYYPEVVYVRYVFDHEVEAHCVKRGLVSIGVAGIPHIIDIHREMVKIAEAAGVEITTKIDY